MKVLLVLPDADLAAVLASALSSAGTEATVVSSSAEACRLMSASSVRPDVVLVDATQQDPELATVSGTQVRTLADVVVDGRSRTATCSGRYVHLSPTEFNLLWYVMGAQGRLLTKRELMVAVWGHEGRPPFGNVEQYLSYLRRKLGRPWADRLQTVRGMGYRLMP